ncbi:MAG: ATP-binding protein [Candidatus Methanomethylicaceae archaeon]
MRIPFYNREKELSLLMEVVSSKRAELVILYGRRRIGKTALSTQLLNMTRGFYIYVENSSLKSFLTNASTIFGRSFKSIDEFLDYAFLELGKENVLLVLDEYQRISRALSPRIQYHWDASSGVSKIKLLLLGSTIGMIERDIGYLGPLYGRATRIIRLNGFDYSDVRKIFKCKERESIEIYSVLGGTPYYLLLYNKSKTLEENIRDLFLKTGAPLYEEVERLLATELRDPSRYLEILEAIGMGRLTLKEISDYTGLERHQLKKYLLTLEKLMLIEREASILKKSVPRYRFRDNFFMFYMRFIHPNIQNIELGQEEYVINKIIEELPTYLGNTFENICLSMISKRLQGYRVGRYWDRDGNEIDVVAIRERDGDVVFFECKMGGVEPSDAVKFKGIASIIAGKLKIPIPKLYFIVPEKTKEEVEGIKVIGVGDNFSE